MTQEVKQRIEQIQRGEVPEGYRRTKDIGMAPKEWRIGKLSDVLHNEQRPVPKPDKPYWRLGVKSWAKGTFHAYVDDPSTVDMDELFVVKEKDLVVNITFAWEQAIALAKKEDEGLLVSHRFPTYMFDDGNVPDFYQAVFGQHFFKGLLDNISPGGAGRNRVLNRKDFLNLPCYIPPIEEQRKIAEILATCDRVIQLKQKLLDELKKLKKVCLEKMFPQESSSVPEIRFSGFTAPWEQQKLIEEVFSVDTGKSKFTPHEVGEYEILGSTSVIGYDDSYDYEGDFLLTARVGANAGELYRHSGKVKISDNTVFIQGKHLDFIYYALLNFDIKKLSFGTGQPLVKASELKEQMISMPVSDSERECIGKYFQNIDDLITLHQRELEAEQQKKKALMKLLLTGIVRTV